MERKYQIIEAMSESRQKRIYQLTDRINCKSLELDIRERQAMRNEDYYTAEKLNDWNINLQKREQKLLDKLREGEK